jgi:hypothetical protein
VSTEADEERAAFGDPEPPPGSPREALSRSRVDLIEMIEAGIPPREFIPGADPLPKRKRAHIAAAAKSGKSLGMGVVTAVDIIEAGGTVAILDRENGADEYARRLEAVLDARQATGTLRERIRVELRYYAWPSMSLSWRDDPAYPAEFAGADVVIFDSSRSHTAPLGLTEDASDDWASFTTSLVDPLMLAGITTITLDNMGHEDKARPRGTSAKEDLCDIAYTMKVVSPFSSTLAGRLELRCSRSRIGEITVGDTWRMDLGGGSYGAWQRVERPTDDARAAFRPTNIMEKVSRAVEQDGGLSKRAIRTVVAGKNDWIDLALELLVSEGFIDAREDGQAHRHYSIRPYREDAESPTVPTVPQPCPNRAPGTAEPTVPPCPDLKEGTGTGHGHGAGENGNRAPDVDAAESARQRVVAKFGETT